jgi:hypothetical protein
VLFEAWENTMKSSLEGLFSVEKPAAHNISHQAGQQDTDKPDQRIIQSTPAHDKPGQAVNQAKHQRQQIPVIFKHHLSLQHETFS